MAKKTKAEIIAEMKREAKRIRDRNYRFRKLPPDKQRVTIAKDVLDLLKAEKIVATCGVYMDLDPDIEEKYWTGNSEFDDETQTWVETMPIEGAEKAQLHQLIEQSETCDVCGIGACFVAAVRRADKATVGDMEHVGDDRFMRTYLSQWFSKKQISLVECAFECRSSFNKGNPTDVANRAADFGEEYEDDGERLAAIFQNIVDNGGTFAP